MAADSSIATLGLGGDEAVGISIMSLVGQADPIVKGVMLILVLSSVWSWTVIFQKVWRFRSLSKRAQTFEREFWSGAALDDLYRRLGTQPDNPMSAAFAAGMEEWAGCAAAQSGEWGSSAPDPRGQGHVTHR